MKNANKKRCITLLAGLTLAENAMADGELTHSQEISYLEGGLGPILADDADSAKRSNGSGTSTEVECRRDDRLAALHDGW